MACVHIRGMSTIQGVGLEGFHCNFVSCCVIYQDSLCSRDELVFIRKLGEGQFGEVMLMVIKVSVNAYVHGTPLCTTLALVSYVLYQCFPQKEIATGCWGGQDDSLPSVLQSCSSKAWLLAITVEPLINFNSVESVVYFIWIITVCISV